MASEAERTSPLLRVDGITKSFPLGRSLFSRGSSVIAVDDVDFSLERGRTIGIVGESGSGKTTLGRIVAGLEKPDRGAVLVEGQDHQTLLRGRRPLLWRKIQLIFQDPQSSLDPRRSIGKTLMDPLLLLRGLSRKSAAEGAAALLEDVRLTEDMLGRYPHQLSGGQRQRVAIARALAAEPTLIVCDEPTSALDVSVQAQILNLLLDLQARRGLAFLLISHDFAVVQYVSDRVLVMYAGQVVEEGPVADVFLAPRHPYTARLLEAIPGRWRDDAEHVALPLASPASSGCPFAPNCARRSEACERERPRLVGHETPWRVACFHPLTDD